MARVRSPEKRTAILEAAMREIAAVGLSASTAKIARRADVATGTLFTYFASKEELLNELYIELKIEVYAKVNDGFPAKGSLEHRAKHIWSSYLDWSIAFPERRRASVLLNLSDLITPETRDRTARERELVDTTFRELGSRGALRTLPAGFAASMMAAMQDATMELIAKRPKHRDEMIDRAFQLFWRAVR